MNNIINKFIFRNAIQIQNYTIRSSYLNNLGNIAFYSTADQNESTERKKTKIIPKITLMSDNNKMEVITLDQAKKIADHRQLKLVKIVDYDTKSSRAIYKLMSSHEYHTEELKRRGEKKEARNQPHIKSEKLLSVSSKISEHDLQAKINKCKKWIEKMHEIRVVISYDGDEQNAEKVSNALENTAKELNARVLQKRNKNENIRFSIMPVIKKVDQHPKEEDNTVKEKKLLEPDALNIQQVRGIHTF